VIELLNALEGSELTYAKLECLNRINSIVRAWLEVDKDDTYTQEQKCNASRSAMSAIWHILDTIKIDLNRE
jgi:hypothetical protein